MERVEVPSKKTYNAVESAIEAAKNLRGTWEELLRKSNVEHWDSEDTSNSIEEAQHLQTTTRRRKAARHLTQ